MGKFVISRRRNDEYQFNLKANNGETILTSEGYVTNQGCRKGIASVKENAPYDSRYDRKRSSSLQWYFNLKAGNGEIIGTSEMYNYESSMEGGIQSVKSNAPDATIEDLS